MKKPVRYALLGAALGAAVSTNAVAAICDGSIASACGSGELFLNVWDEAGAVSYSLDLGVTVDELAGGGVLTKQWNLANTSVAPKFASFLSALGAGRTLVYNVAANNTVGAINSNPYFGVASTFANTPDEVQAAQPTVSLSGIVGTMSSNVRSRVNNLNASAMGDNPGASVTDFAANLDEQSDATEFSYFNDSSWGGDLGGGIGGLSTGADVGTALDLYLLGWSGSGPNSRFEQLGRYRLAADGTLSFTHVSAVPVPAVGLGLAPLMLGLAAHRRRRAQRSA